MGETRICREFLTSENTRLSVKRGKKKKKEKSEKKREKKETEEKEKKKGSTRGVAYGEGSSMNVFESFVS